MKKCRQCGILKPTTEFGKNRSKRDGLQTGCKQCRRIYARKWYSENQELHKSRVVQTSKEYKQKLRKFFYNILLEKRCIDCEESRPACLQYDHKDPTQKSFDISKGISFGYSKETILAEIEKCEVRCANCHAIRTAKQFKWYQW